MARSCRELDTWEDMSLVWWSKRWWVPEHDTIFHCLSPPKGFDFSYGRKDSTWVENFFDGWYNFNFILCYKFIQFKFC